MGENLFAFERAYDRFELAALFEELASAFEDGRAAKIDGDGTRVAFDTPERAFAELELERDRGEEDDEPLTPPIEFEIELEWDGASDGDSGVRIESADAETSSGGAATGTVDRRSRYEVYQDRADEWRWRLVHWNGNIIADSGEGYTTKYNAERALRSVMRNAPTATIEHLE